MDENHDMEQSVNAVLDKLRHYLQDDGGDIEFARWEPESRTLELRFLGNCSDCSLSLMTLRGGIERFILKDIPEVRRVEVVK